MINEIKKDAQERMKKSVESLDHAFAKIRTGRAHPSILDSVMVSYYGADTRCARWPTWSPRTRVPWP